MKNLYDYIIFDFLELHSIGLLLNCIKIHCSILLEKLIYLIQFVAETKFPNSLQVCCNCKIIYLYARIFMKNAHTLNYYQLPQIFTEQRSMFRLHTSTELQIGLASSDIKRQFSWFRYCYNLLETEANKSTNHFILFHRKFFYYI